MRELRFTVYEVLGYLFPGAVTFTALLIVLWGLRWPHFHIDMLNRASRRDLAVVAVFVYILGHLVQAIANWVEKFFDKWLGEGKKRNILKTILKKIVGALKVVFQEEGMNREKQGTQQPEVIKRVREALTDYYNLDASELQERVLNELCDAAVIANGAPEEHHVYVYR